LAHLSKYKTITGKHHKILHGTHWSGLEAVPWPRASTKSNWRATETNGSTDKANHC
jgi:hypothetical protein